MLVRLILLSTTQSPTPSTVADLFARMLSRMEMRWTLIRKLNRLLTVALPLIDLTRVDIAGTSASNLSKCRHLVLQVLKSPLWNEALTKTQMAGDTTLEVRVLVAWGFKAPLAIPQPLCLYPCGCL